MHALKAVPKAQGKKGDGLTKYARQIGKSQPYVSQVYAAARVIEGLHKSTYEVDIASLISKAQHLAEIATADAAEKGCKDSDNLSSSGRRADLCQNSGKSRGGGSAEFCGVVSEALAVEEYFRALETPKAKERQAQAGPKKGKGKKSGSGNLPEAVKGESRDLAAKATGFSATTLRKARAVKEAAYYP